VKPLRNTLSPLGRQLSVVAASIPTNNLALWLDFSDISTLFQDTAGATPITTDGQAIARASDKSGNARHATNATSGQRPLHKASIQNGLSVARPDGINDSLQTASFSLPQPFTVFVVYTAGGGNNRPIHDTPSGTRILFYERAVAPNTHAQFAGAGQIFFPTTTGWHVFTNVYNNTASFAQVDSGSPVTGTLGTGSSTNGFALFRNQGGSEFLNRDVGEILMYSEAVTGSKLTTILSALKTKWGTP
jgi:hypothetical protein